MIKLEEERDDVDLLILAELKSKFHLQYPTLDITQANSLATATLDALLAGIDSDENFKLAGLLADLHVTQLKLTPEEIDARMEWLNDVVLEITEKAANYCQQAVTSSLDEMEKDLTPFDQDIKNWAAEIRRLNVEQNNPNTTVERRKEIMDRVEELFAEISRPPVAH